MINVFNTSLDKSFYRKSRYARGKHLRKQTEPLIFPKPDLGREKKKRGERK